MPKKLIAILMLIVQLGNAAAGLLQTYKPQTAFVVAAVVGTIQSFLDKVQGSTETKQ